MDQQNIVHAKVYCKIFSIILFFQNVDAICLHQRTILVMLILVNVTVSVMHVEQNVMNAVMDSNYSPK